MPTFRVPLKATIDDSYDIEIGERLFDTLIPDLTGGLFPGVHRLAVITDRNVEELYGRELLALLERAGLAASMFSFPAGERYKTRETKAAIEDSLLDAGYGRDSAVIALGGGVVSDLAGFLAGTFARGIPFAVYATTLLAAADASIGGKTAVDTPRVTNIIGLFHQPKKVYIDTHSWNTLTDAEIRNGLAETVKHACLGDRSFFEYLEGHVDAFAGRDQNGRAIDPEVAARVAASNCMIKHKVVAGDVREKNLRQVLNLGHTLGRALEPLANYTLSHGEAVSIGLAFQLKLGERLGYVGAADRDRVVKLLERIGLPMSLPAGLPVERIIASMHTDKKSRRGEIRFVFQKGIGDMMRFEGGAYSRPVPDGVLASVLEESY
ncbi:MAG: 3-dehydroquinate synthase [Spirochaetales bacterium]|nr:3-dehydroquinate synthase [Spirochaetales bacterium]